MGRIHALAGALGSGRRNKGFRTRPFERLGGVPTGCRGNRFPGHLEHFAKSVCKVDRSPRNTRKPEKRYQQDSIRNATGGSVQTPVSEIAIRAWSIAVHATGWVTIRTGALRFRWLF